jgi:glutathione S-transferase
MRTGVLAISIICPMLLRVEPYDLFYWPGIQGRGEFVRLALEDAGVPYVDVARAPGGMPAMMKILREGTDGLAPFAPPFLRSGKLVVAQTSNILAFLGPRHGLVADDEASRVGALQIQLTIADLVAEAHDTHHPIDMGLHYEEQKRPAVARAAAFVRNRIPKFLGWLERTLERGGPWLLGSGFSYADLSAFQVVSGLTYAFPNGMARLTRKIPKLLGLRDRVSERPRIAAYLGSARRLPFGEDDVFRHYPALDPGNAVAKGKGARAKRT